MDGVDLEDLDAQLRALGVDLDEPDPFELTDRADDEPRVENSHGVDGTGPFDVSPVGEWGVDDGERLQWEVLDSYGLDPAVDLPAPVAPPGYYLDARTVLRYEHDSVPVPGQLRVTLARTWRFERDAAVVRVPAVWSRTRPELAWVERVAGPHGSVRVGGGHLAAHEVPVEVWDAMASHCFEVTAPELTVAQLLTVADVAAVAGLSPTSVPTFAARGALPPPTVRVAGSPLWSAPVLGVWLANRRSPGRPRRSRRRR